MTKLFSKLNLTKLFYISPQQNLHPLKITKLFSKLNLTKLFLYITTTGPGTYPRPTSGYDQKLPQS